ncbi:hypothetical protein GCM10027051_33810 [Niabella terrae]
MAVTAFAFATSEKYANSGLYAQINAASFKQLSDQPSVPTPNGANVTVNPANPAIEISVGGTIYPLVYDNGSGTKPQVHTDGTW